MRWLVWFEIRDKQRNAKPEDEALKQWFQIEE